MKEENINLKLFKSGKIPRVIEQDKVEHWAFGFVLTFFAIINPWLIFLGYAFGIGKEIMDYRKGRPDLKDMLATFVGAGMALILLAFIGVFHWGMLF